LLVPLWFAFQSLVQGETCPAPVDVEARVRVILHLSPEQELSEGFIVERHEAGLYVELRSADSTLIGQRTLPTAGTCDELAQAAAVVLSTWLSDVHPDFAGALPAPVPQPEPEPQPEPQPEPPPPRTRSTEDSKLQARPTSPPAPPPGRPTPRAWDLALGLGSDFTGGHFALALPFSVGYLAVGGGFGLAAMTIATPSRKDPLGPGQVNWRRWPLGVGPSLRVGQPRLAWDFSPGVAVGWLHVSGTNFDHTSQQDGVVWGGYLNLRASSRGPHWGVFALADAQFYPGEARVYVTGISAAWTVPALSLALAVGVDFSP
jgi:hypothetical protein